MIRYYFAPKIVGVTNDPAVKLSIDCVDGGNWYFGGIDLTPAQHAAYIATAGVVYLPLEGPLGFLSYNNAISDLSNANRNFIKNECEIRHIPMHVLTLQHLIRRVFRFIEIRALVREILGPDDFVEGLDTTVGAIAAARRLIIRNKLEAVGISFAGVGLADLIRDVFILIGKQAVNILRTTTAEDD